MMLLSASYGQGELEKGHRIFQFEVHRELNKRQIELILKQDYTGDSDPRNMLLWSLSLDKKEYDVGEIIWARLEVNNISQQSSFRFSEPFHGRLVSNLSPWISESVDTDSSTEWTELKEAYQVDKGYPDARLAYRGKPIILPPKGTYECWIPVNVAQNILYPDSRNLFGKSGWIPNTGFSEPGKYQFYLRYVNLEAYTARRYRSMFSGKTDLPPIDAEKDAVDIPREPRLIGPFVVSITSGKDAGFPRKLEDLLVPLREQSFISEDKIDIRIPSVSREMARGAFGGDLRDSRRWPMEFCFVTSSSVKYEIPFAANSSPSKVAADRLKLRNLEAIRSNLSQTDPLRQFVEFEICLVLDALGQTEQAVELAKQIDNPDAHVLLDLIRIRTDEKSLTN